VKSWLIDLVSLLPCTPAQPPKLRRSTDSGTAHSVVAMM
jgi:hypothetical protein